jgi:hypothetical protein
MLFLWNVSTLDFEQRLDGILSVSQDAPQFSAPSIPGSKNLSKRNCGSSQVSADSPAQESVLVEDADLAHITRVKP